MSLVSSTELTTEQSLKLKELIDALPSVLEKLENPDFDEIFGYRIAELGVEYVDFHARNEILLKFLVACEYDLDLTKKKLADTMNWRGNLNILSAAYIEDFDNELKQMGLITEFLGNNNNVRVTTWNFYNNVKLTKSYFEGFKKDANGNEKEPNPQTLGSQFLRWRVGLMERSLALLDFTDSENSKMAQVHDYKGVSMFRIDSDMKAATKEIVKVFSDHYPELLSKKFFVNVPMLMGWVFLLFKATGIISPSTLKRFEVLSNGDLSDLLGHGNLPADYNGGISNPKVPDVQSMALQALKIEIPVYARILLQKQGILKSSFES